MGVLAPHLSPPSDAEAYTADLPWPQRRRYKIWPIFLPQLGCPGRCLFCGQESQTGQRAHPDADALERHLRQTGADLLKVSHAPPQLAFYGGTFTALPESYLELCLQYAAIWRHQGLISGFRCSTRPDALNEAIILRLRRHGCELVELGIQTFAPKALAASGRQHTRAQNLQATQLLKNAGLPFGIQLLPGLPGSGPKDFLRDVEIAVAQGATCLRFYPCLVIEGTPLAMLWRRGQFTPWTLATALDQLTRGFLTACQRQVPVIRMGLAPQDGLGILAGPWHEALGSRIMGRALALFAAIHRHGSRCSIFVPSNARGCIGGWRRELGDFWRRQNLQAIVPWSKPLVRVVWS